MKRINSLRLAYGQVQQNETGLLALNHQFIHHIDQLGQEIEAQIIAHNDQIVQETKELEDENDPVFNHSNSSCGSDKKDLFEEDREGEILLLRNT